MEHTGLWRRMRYGKSESYIERGMAVLLLCVCAAEEAKRSIIAVMLYEYRQ